VDPETVYTLVDAAEEARAGRSDASTWRTAKPFALYKPSPTNSFTALPAPTSHAATLAAYVNTAPVGYPAVVPSPSLRSSAVFSRPATLMVSPVVASTRRTNLLSAANK
jgi:hypothetical protein